jgi:transcriptional regulator with XRE-family HTH domain
VLLGNTGDGTAPVRNKVKARDPIDAEVGHRIRIHRNAISMSQSTLGEKLGVTFQQVQKYEKGVNRVGAGRLTRIAGILEIPVGALLGVDVDQPKIQSSSAASNVLECLSMPGAVRLVQAYAQLPNPAIRSTILSLVEQIAQAKSE